MQTKKMVAVDSKMFALFACGPGSQILNMQKNFYIDVEIFAFINFHPLDFLRCLIVSKTLLMP